MPEIVEWTEIANQYDDTFLLGNGASMALHPDCLFLQVASCTESKAIRRTPLLAAARIWKQS